MNDFGLELMDVNTEEEVERMRQMMLGPETWRNLGFRQEPGKGSFYLLFHNQRYAGHLVRERDTNREIGFFIIGLAKLKRLNAVEVDGCLSESERGKRLSRIAAALTLDYWLSSGRCDTCFTWMDAANTPSINSARSLGLEISDPVEGGRIVEGGPAEAVEVIVTKAQWDVLRETFGFGPFVAPKDGIFPPKD